MIFDRNASNFELLHKNIHLVFIISTCVVMFGIIYFFNIPPYSLNSKNGYNASLIIMLGFAFKCFISGMETVDIKSKFEYTSKTIYLNIGNIIILVGFNLVVYHIFAVVLSVPLLIYYIYVIASYEGVIAKPKNIYGWSPALCWEIEWRTILIITIIGIGIEYVSLYNMPSESGAVVNSLRFS